MNWSVTSSTHMLAVTSSTHIHMLEYQQTHMLSTLIALSSWHWRVLFLNSGTVLQLADGSSVRCDVVVGADGSNSVVAQHLGLQPPNYAGYVAYRWAHWYRVTLALLLPCLLVETGGIRSYSCVL